MKANYFWRQVESSSADQLEFHQGGEKLRFWVGISIIGVALLHAPFLGWVLVKESSEVLQEFRLLRGQILRDFQSWEWQLFDLELLCAWFAVVACVELVLGLSMAFGKARLTVNRATRELQKHFQLFRWIRETSFDARDAMCISIGPGPVVLRLLFGLHGIFLHSQARGRQRFLTMHWRKLPQARELAQQIAAFLDIPGPTDSAG